MTDHDISGHQEDSPDTDGGDGFDTLGLRPELLKTIADLGYEEPTPIQRETIPHLLAGRDLLGQAATGTGISYMQMELAHRDGVLIPEQKAEPEDPKQPDELLAADRGGL
jgi:hypothetical protein